MRRAAADAVYRRATFRLASLLEDDDDDDDDDDGGGIHTSGTSMMKLTPAEKEEWRRGLARVEQVVRTAQAMGVCVYVDAEHAYFQDAIDMVVRELMISYNRGSSSHARPTVAHTYQVRKKQKEY